MSDYDAAYEEYLPTDKFAIQDMFLMRIHLLGVKYRAIALSTYRNGVDMRAITEFYSVADEFYIFASSNIEKHLTTKEVTELRSYFTIRTPKDADRARRIYELFNVFATKSKLTELSEKKFMGSFAYARRELGMSRSQKRESQ